MNSTPQELQRVESCVVLCPKFITLPQAPIKRLKCPYSGREWVKKPMTDKWGTKYQKGWMFYICEKLLAASLQSLQLKSEVHVRSYTSRKCSQKSQVSHWDACMYHQEKLCAPSQIESHDVIVISNMKWPGVPDRTLSSRGLQEAHQGEYKKPQDISWKGKKQQASVGSELTILWPYQSSPGILHHNRIKRDVLGCLKLLFSFLIGLINWNCGICW